MDRWVGSEMVSRSLAPLHVLLLIFGAVLPLLALQAGDSPSATGIAAMAFVAGVLIAMALTIRLAAWAGSTNRPLAAYRSRAELSMESYDPPAHPVRPRAPGLV